MIAPKGCLHGMALLFLPLALWAQPRYSVGGGIPFNTNIESPGLNLRGYYNIGERFCFGPEFTYFLPREKRVEEEDVRKTIWELNLNAHYIFELSEELGAYPIFGLNYTREREEIDYIESEEFEELFKDAVGLNLGFGFHLPLDGITPFVEYEYVVSQLSEHIITFGVFVDLKKKQPFRREGE